MKTYQVNDKDNENLCMKLAEFEHAKSVYGNFCIAYEQRVKDLDKAKKDCFDKVKETERKFKDMYEFILDHTLPANENKDNFVYDNALKQFIEKPPSVPNIKLADGLPAPIIPVPEEHAKKSKKKKE